MQHCSKCNIDIRGNKSCCPLCQGNLIGEPEDPAFPVLPERRLSRGMFLRICVFIFIVVELAMMLVNYFTDSRFYLPGMVILWAPFVLLDICLAVYFRSNILKLVTIETCLFLLVVLCLDGRDGRLSWSIAWVIPITILCLVLLTNILAWITRRRLVDYVVYLALDTVLALLQTLSVFYDRNPYPAMSLITGVVMLIYAAYVGLFRYRELKNALSKYMNV